MDIRLNEKRKQNEWKRNSAAKEQAIVQGENYRFTVMTDYLIRMEYQENGIFMDEPTQTVIFRNFDVPDFKVVDKEDQLEIITKALHLYYDKKIFSSEGLFITLKEGFGVGDSVWNYKDQIHDLRGTARTLDDADGAVDLESGLMSMEGFSVIDDSKAALLSEDGWVASRDWEEVDMYFFGYGHDYLRCLKDFYRLSGAVPLLPKYTLGNWWSRFYPYSEESYLKLMKQFDEKAIPIAVSVIDMDWHLKDIPAKYGSGWTGYTWNRELFPEPERFLRRLHEMGKRVTLNLHPADGVRAFEEPYLSMAKALGVDYEHKEKIPFNVMDRDYMKAYFEYLHHPYEKMGVDFWWIDWQQGKQSRVKGIDPLWMLNYLHFTDSGREGKLPLTFSRYAGLGSHRYPIGFSGDSISSWATLDFQPYFTANASNAGYSWWSHDIGGHQKGRRDDELIVRWVQFGVFSPIMRLHSTANEFYGKEPWNYNMIAEKVITEFLQLRHRLIPYLYTMNYRTHLQGIPLIQPMYYRHDEKNAYNCPNEYYFGDMIICPITHPVNRETLLAEVDAWIPEGTYYDLFTGQIYRGGRRMMLYRSIETIPVLVPAGSIIPMAGDIESSCEQNPEKMEIIVFNGGNGEFELYEDDCSNTVNMEPVITKFTFKSGQMAHFTMRLQEDKQAVIPRSREYCIRIRGMEKVDAGNIEICKPDSDGAIHVEASYNDAFREVVIKVSGEKIRQFDVVVKQAFNLIALSDKKEEIRRILHQAQIEYDLKETIFELINREEKIGRIVEELYEIIPKNGIFGAILERLTADIQ